MLLIFFALNIISVTWTVLALFETFSNANRLGKAWIFDTVQSTRPPSWIFGEGIAQYLWRHKSRGNLIKLQKLSINWFWDYEFALVLSNLSINEENY